jgi:glycosyltransferase involved in cell wall biosynthesis
MLRIERQYLNAINRFFANTHFDLILYSTPPITLAGVVRSLKKRNRATTYLMLKDIFPQNAVDLDMMQTRGLKGLLYKYFRRKEKKLYAISDYIGCMSPANVSYVLKHNPEVPSETVHICPNSIEPQDVAITEEERNTMRDKYGIPRDKVVFVYGGNLGKPQGIPFIADCLRSQQDNAQAFFLIVGDGTEYARLEQLVQDVSPKNVKVMQRLPKDDYDRMVSACDVGMIFLDHRFTIPNFPSRLLSYMQAGLPVLACTDPNTDVGEVITEGGFGWWCESNDVRSFGRLVDTAIQSDLKAFSENAKDYLYKHYHVAKTYRSIMEMIEKNRL